MKTLLKYEVDFGSTIYQTHAIQSIQIVLSFITDQGVEKGFGICEGVVLRKNIIW
jgi:hypothetical protein